MRKSPELRLVMVAYLSTFITALL